MKKRTITKQSLAELAKVIPVVPEWEMATIVGGGTGALRGASGNPYSMSEFESMSDSGTWITGAYVEGLGFVGAQVTVTGIHSDSFSHVSSTYFVPNVGINGVYRIEGDHYVRDNVLHVSVSTPKIDRYYDSTISARVILYVNGVERSSQMVSITRDVIHSSSYTFLGEASFNLPPSGLIQYKVESSMNINDPSGNASATGSSMVTVRNY